MSEAAASEEPPECSGILERADGSSLEIENKFKKRKRKRLCGRSGASGDAIERPRRGAANIWAKLLIFMLINQVYLIIGSRGLEVVGGDKLRSMNRQQYVGMEGPRVYSLLAGNEQKIDQSIWDHEGQLEIFKQIGEQPANDNSSTWALLMGALFYNGQGFRAQVNWFNCLLALVLILLMLTTAIGNLFVIVAILIERDLRTIGNYLVLSLAIADLLVACLVMPLAGIYQILDSWTLGILLCDIWTSADVFCCTASILHLLAIALDRYWAVTRIDYIRCQRNERRILLMISFVWTAASIISLAPIFGWKDAKFEWRITNDHECLISQDVGYQIFATCTTFYFPLTLTLIFYWKIFQVARKRIRRKPGNRIKISLQHPSSSSSISSPGSKQYLQQPKLQFKPQIATKFQSKDSKRWTTGQPEAGEPAEGAPKLEGLCQCSCHANYIQANQVAWPRERANELAPANAPTIPCKTGQSEQADNSPPSNGPPADREDPLGSSGNPLEVGPQRLVSAEPEGELNKQVCEQAACLGALNLNRMLELGSQNTIAIDKSSSCLSMIRCEHCQQASSNDLHCLGTSNSNNNEQQQQQHFLNNQPFLSKRTSNSNRRRPQRRQKIDLATLNGKANNGAGKQAHSSISNSNSNSISNSDSNSNSNSNLNSNSEDAGASLNEAGARSSSSCSPQSSLLGLLQGRRLDGGGPESKCVDSYENCCGCCNGNSTPLIENSGPEANGGGFEFNEKRPTLASTELRQQVLGREQEAHREFISDESHAIVKLAMPPGNGPESEPRCGPSQLPLARRMKLFNLLQAPKLVRIWDQLRKPKNLFQAKSLKQQQQQNYAKQLVTVDLEGRSKLVSSCKYCNCDIAPLVGESARNQSIGASSSEKMDEQQASRMLIVTATAGLAVSTSAQVNAKQIKSSSPLKIGNHTTNSSIQQTTGNSSNNDFIQNHSTASEGIESKRERKAAKTLAIITGVFVMCWLPFFIMALTMSLLNLKPHKYLFAFLLWLGYANSMLNPIIYTIFSPDFRKAFKRLLCAPMVDNGAKDNRGSVRANNGFNRRNLQSAPPVGTNSSSLINWFSCKIKAQSQQPAKI